MSVWERHLFRDFQLIPAPIERNDDDDKNTDRSKLKPNKNGTKNVRRFARRVKAVKPNSPVDHLNLSPNKLKKTRPMIKSK